MLMLSNRRIYFSLNLTLVISSFSDYARKQSFSCITCIVTKFRFGYKYSSLKIAFVEFLKLFLHLILFSTSNIARTKF